MMAELNKALGELEKNADVRCVVITGAGANFCGGADVSAFASGQVEDAFNFSEAPHEVFTRIETYPKPVIAAINGAAMGGGLELALGLRYQDNEQDSHVASAGTDAGTSARRGRHAAPRAA